MDIKFSIKDSNDMAPTTVLNQFSEITDNYEFFRIADSFRFLTEGVDGVRKMFENHPNQENIFSAGLAKIKISISSNQNRSDVVSYVTEVLHSEGVEILDTYFSQDSIIVVLDETNASKAYDVLHSEIARTRWQYNYHYLSQT